MANNGHGNAVLKEEIESGSPDMKRARLPRDNQENSDNEVIVDVAAPHMSEYESESNVVPDGPLSRKTRRYFSPGFKVALFRELQRDDGSNPFRSRRRDDKRQSWDALADRLKSLTQVEISDGMGKRTLPVEAPTHVSASSSPRWQGL